MQENTFSLDTELKEFDEDGPGQGLGPDNAYKLFLYTFVSIVLDYIHFSEDDPPEDKEAFIIAERWLTKKNQKLQLAGERFTFEEAISYMFDLPLDSLEFEERFTELKKNIFLAGSNYSCYRENKDKDNCDSNKHFCRNCPKSTGKKNYDPRGILFAPSPKMKKKEDI